MNPNFHKASDNKKKKTAGLPRRRVKCQSSWTVQVHPDKHFPWWSIQSCHLNAVFVHVSPVNVVGHPIHCHPLRRAQAKFDDVLKWAAVKERPTNTLWRHKPKQDVSKSNEDFYALKERETQDYSGLKWSDPQPPNIRICKDLKVSHSQTKKTTTNFRQLPEEVWA